MEEEMADLQQNHPIQQNGTRKPSPNQPGDLAEEKIQALPKNGDADFDKWTCFVSDSEKTLLNDAGAICKVYDAFLSEFPLCQSYWKKYASYVANNLSLSEAETVYERAVKAIPYSVSLWVSYFTFGKLAYEDPDDVRRLFERGLSYVGKDYSSHLLWDKYIEFEYFHKRWNRLAYVLINTLRYPTKKLDHYYASFKNFTGLWAKAVGCEKATMESGSGYEITDGKACEHSEVMDVIRTLLDEKINLPTPSMVSKYISVGELLYQKSSQLDKKISSYEARIKRPYFHVEPVDDCQLKNWHQYLDFVEMQEDFDWAVKLYERCLVPCANYPHFWIRYVEFTESKGGREIAKHALGRAQVLLKRVPAFHLYCSMFKEKIGDVNGARAPFVQDEIRLNPEFIESVNREANMEKRMGNTEAAYMVYEKAVGMAKAKQNLQILAILYTKFARFTYAVNGNIDASIDVFVKAIQQVPCKSLIQEMIDFIAFCGGPGQIPKLDSIIANTIAQDSAISQELTSHEREEISTLFLEFVDLYGNIHEIRKAWDRHWKLFPHSMKPVTRSQCTPIGDDHDGSRMLLVDSKNLTGNDHQTPEQEGMETVKGKGDINDNNGREEPPERDKIVKNQSIAEGTELHMEITELSDKIVENQPIPEGTELHKENTEPSDEPHVVGHIPDGAPECPKGDSKIQICSEQPPSLENLAINFPVNQIQQFNLPASPHPNNPMEITVVAPNPNPNEQISSQEKGLQDDNNNNEVSATRVSGPIEMKPSTPSHVMQDKDKSDAAVKMQAHTHSDMHRSSTVSNVTHPQNTTSGGHWGQTYYAQLSQSQQLQVSPHYSQGNQTYPTGNLTWPGQSMQQQQAAYAYMQQPQSSTNTQVQAQANQQTVSNEQQQQYGYVQNGQEIPPQMWHYYQQQYYYLQQQQQQQQQLLLLQQHQQLQQSHHLQSNSQQEQTNPQQPSDTSQQVSNHHQQQQQLAQYQEQQKQQYQLLLYMQQQQQQQFYMQQQQQLYAQQQQILQQEQFQQLTQQQQQLLLQQQQQLLLQQQQQQFLELQQQQQQQLQQLLQQPVQQQQDPKALASNYIQQSRQAQHVSNQGGRECSEGAITLQDEGDKLRSSEQSGPSVSPHPQNS